MIYASDRNRHKHRRVSPGGFCRRNYAKLLRELLLYPRRSRSNLSTSVAKMLLTRCVIRVPLEVSCFHLAKKLDIKADIMSSIMYPLLYPAVAMKYGVNYGDLSIFNIVYPRYQHWRSRYG